MLFTRLLIKLIVFLNYKIVDPYIVDPLWQLIKKRRQNKIDQLIETHRNCSQPTNDPVQDAKDAGVRFM